MADAYSHYNELLKSATTGFSNPELYLGKLYQRVRIMVPSLSEGEIYQYVSQIFLANRQLARELLETHIFNVTPELGHLLEISKNKIYNRHLPFDNMWVSGYDLKVRENLTYTGFHIYKDKWGTSIRCMFYYGSGIEIHTIPFFDSYFKEHPEKRQQQEAQHKIAENICEKELPTKSEKKKICLWVCNLLDFLETPDAKVVTVERTPKQNQQRILRGKLPIPPIHHIQITGQLKIYLDSLNSGAYTSYSHKFWVRGHFRTLRSIKWKNKQGTKIWIYPFIKGRGILIQSTYNLNQSLGVVA